MHFKDAVLDELAARANIAQFVSFGPDLKQRFSRIFGCAPNQRFKTLEEAVAILLQHSGSKSVNVRSFAPHDPKSREFVYGLASTDAAVNTLRRLAAEGLYTVLNETVDVNDGGVSGVVLGEVIEFAPGDTPRCVEKPGTAALPRALGLRLLRTVYGFDPALEYGRETRVEFSIHPLRQGVRAEHTIIWELETVGASPSQVDTRWPNKFSELLGDKAYGLLIAHVFGLHVPHTTVISRAVAPFSFGRSPRSGEIWLRTCPRTQVPGRFTTRRGWSDPFALLSEEDPRGELLASVIAQEGVSAEYSGAAIAPEADPDSLIVEGVAGFGDRFMVGEAAPGSLPRSVTMAVHRLYRRAFQRMQGPVRLEWAWDGRRPWILQFHRGGTVSHGSTIVPGAPAHYHVYDVRQGLEPLRRLIRQVQGSNTGVVLVGEVGITSHFGDVLRKAQIPSRIERKPTSYDTVERARVSA